MRSTAARRTDSGPTAWYTGRMDTPVTIVGAGPSGLALAYELQRLGLRATLLERGRVGETWARQYEGLRLHSLASASALPGLPWRGASRFPSAAEMVAYLRAYAERFELDVRERVEVTGVTRGDGVWRLETSAGAWPANRLVLATGIWSAPFEPLLPGRERYGGRLLHVSAYRGSAELAGQRVLVVGAGNSGKDVALAAASVGASATLAMRDGVVLVDYPNALSQRSGALWRRLPPALADRLLRRVRKEHRDGGLRWPARSPSTVYPVVGLELLEAVRTGAVRVRPGVAGFTPEGVRFDDGSEGDFDVVVLCTGYRPALGPLAGVVPLGAGGLPVLEPDGATVAGAPGLYLVGYRYPTLETFLQRLRREARGVARVVAKALDRAQA